MKILLLVARAAGVLSGLALIVALPLWLSDSHPFSSPTWAGYAATALCVFAGVVMIAATLVDMEVRPRVVTALTALALAAGWVGGVAVFGSFTEPPAPAPLAVRVDVTQDCRLFGAHTPPGVKVTSEGGLCHVRADASHGAVEIVRSGPADAEPIKVVNDACQVEFTFPVYNGQVRLFVNGWGLSAQDSADVSGSNSQLLGWNCLR